jgi:hypothetical protein
MGREPLFCFGDCLVEDFEPMSELFYCLHRGCFSSVLITTEEKMQSGNKPTKNPNQMF